MPLQEAGRGDAEQRDLHLPAEAELILSAIDTARHGLDGDRRALTRHSYRVRGRLKFFSDAPHSSPREIYTRDANARGLGFITAHRLPLGHGGFVEFVGPDGRARRIQCTLQRCRQAAPGWFEGTVCFNREQPEFDDVEAAAERAAHQREAVEEAASVSPT